MIILRRGSVGSVINNAIIGLKKKKKKIDNPFSKEINNFLFNINSKRNRFDSLSFMIEYNVDILLISETRLDGLFASDQFKICGFSVPYQYDRDWMGGGHLLYIRDDIPNELLKHDFGTNIENFSVEINF